MSDIPAAGPLGLISAFGYLIDTSEWLGWGALLPLITVKPNVRFRALVAGGRNDRHRALSRQSPELQSAQKKGGRNGRQVFVMKEPLHRVAGGTYFNARKRP
ncbi:MAG: hypothetical protein JNL35_18360 [Sphingopyxis sp.]|nr:hypothetical protein [Sphingopyxis sp.]